MLGFLDLTPDDVAGETAVENGGGFWDIAGNFGEKLLGAANKYADDTIADFLGDDDTDPVQTKPSDVGTQPSETDVTGKAFFRSEGANFIIGGIAINKMVVYGTGLVLGGLAVAKVVK